MKNSSSTYPRAFRSRGVWVSAAASNGRDVAVTGIGPATRGTGVTAAIVCAPAACTTSKTKMPPAAHLIVNLPRQTSGLQLVVMTADAVLVDHLSLRGRPRRHLRTTP